MASRNFLLRASGLLVMAGLLASTASAQDLWERRSNSS